MRFPENLKYTKDHEWIRVDGKVATIGVTDHAQSALGDVVYVELPAAAVNVIRRSASSTQNEMICAGMSRLVHDVSWLATGAGWLGDCAGGLAATRSAASMPELGCAPVRVRVACGPRRRARFG